MAASDLTVTVQVFGDLPAEDKATWDDLVSAFVDEVPHPERVELIITDRFEQIAGELAVLSPVRSNEEMTAADYRAGKPDGALAVARTIPLPDNRVAVVASAGLARAHKGLALTALIHEAQHVRLHQHGDAALGVHRQVAFDLPTSLQFEFVWLAEGLVDEFRCERAMHEKGMGSADNSWVRDYPGIVALFDVCRRDFERTGDLMAAYRAAFAALERLSTFLAYSAASIVPSSELPSEWIPINVMPAVLNAVQPIPAPPVVVTHVELATTAVVLAHALREALQEMDFDLFLTADDTKYFTTVVH
jgi:hypothetical protein